MNYAQFAEYVRQVENELVERFGVPREAAKAIATRIEVDGVNAESSARKERQLILDYQERGPVELAEITGLSRETLRRRYNEAIAKQSPHSVAA